MLALCDIIPFSGWMTMATAPMPHIFCVVNSLFSYHFLNDVLYSTCIL